MKKTILIILSIMLTGSANAANLAQSLQNKMNYLTARQAVIAGNIANASTPNYLAKDIVYKSSEGNTSGVKMAKTNPKHMVFTGNKVNGFQEMLDTTFIRNDGNSVRQDQQMLNLAKIQQEYTMATRLFAKHLAMQKLVIQTQN